MPCLGTDAVKAHLLLYIRDGAPHRKLGSWLRAIENPGCSGPPSQPDIDRILSSVQADVLASNGYEPASDKGWPFDERKLGLDRIFRVVLQSWRLPDGAVLQELDDLSVVDRVVHGVDPPREFRWSPPQLDNQAIGQAKPGALRKHGTTCGDPEVVIAVLDTGFVIDQPEYAPRLQNAVSTLSRSSTGRQHLWAMY